MFLLVEENSMVGKMEGNSNLKLLQAEMRI
jgi:hypothetical protein